MLAVPAIVAARLKPPVSPLLPFSAPRIGLATPFMSEPPRLPRVLCINMLWMAFSSRVLPTSAAFYVKPLIGPVLAVPSIGERCVSFLVKGVA